MIDRDDILERMKRILEEGKANTEHLQLSSGRPIAGSLWASSVELILIDALCEAVNEELKALQAKALDTVERFADAYEKSRT